MPATVLGVRHGLVENPDNVIYARLPGFALSAEGEDAAERLAEKLASSDVVAVYASPLQRAQETAAILAAPHELEVRTDERLIEWSFWSRWQGKPWLTVRDEAPEIFRAYADDPGSLCPEDPLTAVGERMLSWAAEASTIHPGGTVIGVSHEAPLVASLLMGSGQDVGRFSATNVGHLRSVRLSPLPAVIVGE